MAFPAVMNAGISAAKGRRPPFCLVRLLLLLLVPLHLFFSSSNHDVSDFYASIF